MRWGDLIVAQHKLLGRIKIKNGDESTFVADRTTAPERPIPDPPRYRDKWRRRR
jgi:hypothetical protein